jgi:hypothetical protein
MDMDVALAHFAIAFLEVKAACYARNAVVRYAESAGFRIAFISGGGTRIRSARNWDLMTGAG